MPRPSASAKSTKQELLSAYEQLVQELEKRDQASEPTTLSDKKPGFKETLAQQPEQIVSHLGELRVRINKNLADIVDRLVEQSDHLRQMKEEEQTLHTDIETLHQIKVHATTLRTMLTLKEEEENNLEKSRAEKQDEWAKEQDLREKEWKESETQQDKQRKREEEEYQYGLKMKRQKEEDDYKEKRKQAEEEFLKRKHDLEEKEEMFKQLQKQVTELEKRLETEVNAVRKETQERVTKELSNTYNLEKKEIDGERNVSKLTIANLQKTITGQDAEIKDLKQQLTHSTQQIKEIAVSLIDVKKPVIISPTKNDER